MTYLAVPIIPPVTLDGYPLSRRWHAVDLLTAEGVHCGRYYSEVSHEDAAAYGRAQQRMLEAQGALLGAVLGGMA